MRSRFYPAPATDAQPSAPISPTEVTPTKRRGVTSMEYLVMISFILLAVILGVQNIGVMTGGLLRSSADATAKTNGP